MREFTPQDSDKYVIKRLKYHPKVAHSPNGGFVVWQGLHQWKAYPETVEVHKPPTHKSRRKAIIAFINSFLREHPT